MNIRRTASRLFCLLGILLLSGSFLLCLLCKDASPRLLRSPEAAMELTEDFMKALDSGDLDGAGAMLLGQPRLTFEWAGVSSMAVPLWTGYIDSIQFSLQDSLMPTDSGCCRSVRVTALDIPALMQQLKEAAPDLLAQEAAEIGEDQAFGEDNHYRQDFVMEVLYQGVQDLLDGSCPTVSREYTLNLVLQENVWKILPDPALLDLLCGKIA